VIAIRRLAFKDVVAVSVVLLVELDSTTTRVEKTPVGSISATCHVICVCKLFLLLMMCSIVEWVESAIEFERWADDH